MYTEKDIMDELRKFVHSKEGQKYLADQGVSVGGYSQEEIVRISEELRQKIIDGYYNAITENRSEASQSIEEFIVGSPVKELVVVGKLTCLYRKNIFIDRLYIKKVAETNIRARVLRISLL